MAFIKKLLGLDVPAMNVPTYASEYFGKNHHVLIDVRTAHEFRSGHIKGAKNIPLNELGNKLNKIPKDKEVVFVCQSGNRSASATRALMQAGYDNVINLKGGMVIWRMNGHPIA